MLKKISFTRCWDYDPLTSEHALYLLAPARATEAAAVRAFGDLLGRRPRRVEHRDAWLLVGPVFEDVVAAPRCSFDPRWRGHINGDGTVMYRGRTQTVAAWARETGIGYFTLRSRIYDLNWSVERALTEPVRPTSSSPATRP